MCQYGLGEKNRPVQFKQVDGWKNSPNIPAKLNTWFVHHISDDKTSLSSENRQNATHSAF